MSLGFFDPAQDKPGVPPVETKVEVRYTCLDDAPGDMLAAMAADDNVYAVNMARTRDGEWQVSIHTGRFNNSMCYMDIELNDALSTAYMAYKERFGK